MDIFSFFSTDFWQTHALCLMFVSAFLSATVLPGNSEVVFVALAVPKLVLGSLFSTDILALVFFATLGNGLGSLTTYGIGRWMPKFDPKNHRTLWAMNQIKRYGAITLLLSWLPVVGDLLWGSDNICIRKKKKFGGKKLVGAPVCGALAFFRGKFMQKWKMVGIGGKWSKIGFYFA